MRCNKKRRLRGERGGVVCNVGVGCYLTIDRNPAGIGVEKFISFFVTGWTKRRVRA